MKKVACLGASGYTGRELAQLLERHPSVRLDGFFSGRAGEDPAPPELPIDRAVEPLDWARIERVDGVFLCTPHGASAELARRALALGRKVVDLSADFRMDTAGEAVYGLTEHARAAVRSARLVANPGCYPTAVLLALKPLLAAGLVDLSTTVVADCKSGVSGAGKTPSARTHFGATHENALAYAVGVHRHAPEIHLHAGTDRIAFVPHLLPVFRGILATIYLRPAAGASADAARACLHEAYAGERFVRVFERGFPELNRVQRTNECHLAVGACNDLVVVVSAIDNLVKGAAGQALQNMNLMLGLEEGAGLS